MAITSKEQNQLSDPKTDLIKRTFCKGATDDELELFMLACKRTGLDPFAKQIYAVKRWSSADKREVMSMQTSIDGYRLVAERTGNYSPGREATFVYDDKKNLVSATSYVKKMTKDGTWHEIAATAHFDEYVQKTKEGKPTSFWDRMPHVMLAKCAESLALRKAFPAELSGIYTQEEMASADQQIDDKKYIPLTEGQYAQLDFLLREMNDESYVQKLENHLKISSIYEINNESFEKVISAIETRINRKKEANNGQEKVATVA